MPRQEDYNPETESNQEIDRNEQRLRERINSHAGDVFDSNDMGEKRAEAILKKLDLDPFLDQENFDQEYIDKDTFNSMIERIKSAASIEDRENFIQEIKEALEPIVELYQDHPKEFEEVARQAFFRNSGFAAVNEIIAYKLYEDEMSLHLAPATTMTLSEKRTYVNQGLVKLAKIVEEDKNVSVITATSWVVAKNPKLFEGMGFTVTGEISDEEKEEHFDDEQRAVAKASISREDFLEKFSK